MTAIKLWIDWDGDWELANGQPGSQGNAAVTASPHAENSEKHCTDCGPLSCVNMGEQTKKEYYDQGTGDDEVGVHYGRVLTSCQFATILRQLIVTRSQ